jgi:hypothetical protein
VSLTFLIPDKSSVANVIAARCVWRRRREPPNDPQTPLRTTLGPEWEIEGLGLFGGTLGRLVEPYAVRGVAGYDPVVLGVFERLA